MYFRAVFRSMPASMAACPTACCLLISSISFLTCASLTGQKLPAGTVVDSKELQIPLLQPGASHSFSVEMKGADIAGWRYRQK